MLKQQTLQLDHGSTPDEVTELRHQIMDPLLMDLTYLCSYQAGRCKELACVLIMVLRLLWGKDPMFNAEGISHRPSGSTLSNIKCTCKLAVPLAVAQLKALLTKAHRSYKMLGPY